MWLSPDSIFEWLTMLFQFLAVQETTVWLALFPWHLLLLLLILGILAAIGLSTLLHKLLFVEGSKLERMFDRVLLIFLLFALPVWLGCYLLVIQAESLLNYQWSAPVRTESKAAIGKKLLNPLALQSNKNLPVSEDLIKHADITKHIQAVASNTYRHTLKASLYHSAAKTPSEVMAKMAGFWMVGHRESWPINDGSAAENVSAVPTLQSDLLPNQPITHAPLAPSQETRFLMAFLEALTTTTYINFDTIFKADALAADKTDFSLRQWQKIVGYRFIQLRFHQVLIEWLSLIGIGVASLLFVVFIGLLSGWGYLTHRHRNRQQAAKSAQLDIAPLPAEHIVGAGDEQFNQAERGLLSQPQEDAPFTPTATSPLGHATATTPLYPRLAGQPIVASASSFTWFHAIGLTKKRIINGTKALAKASVSTCRWIITTGRRLF